MSFNDSELTESKSESVAVKDAGSPPYMSSYSIHTNAESQQSLGRSNHDKELQMID